MTEDGYRRCKKFAAEAGIDEGEALVHLSSRTSTAWIDEENLTRKTAALMRNWTGRKR